MRDKRNVMWRACLDLQEMLDDIMLRRAQLIGDRKRAGNGLKRLKKERGRALTSGSGPNGKRKETTSEG